MTDGEQVHMAVNYRTPSGLTVKRIQPAIGAEIEGADLCRPIPSNAANDIRQALLDHGVIFFRDQPVTYEQHVALARLFGEPSIEGILPDRPEIMPLLSNPEATNPAGGHWHSDGTYLPVAPAVSVLHAIMAAPLGGDTLFASATAAYDGLPDEVKRRIAPLRARSSMRHIRKVKGLETHNPDYFDSDKGPKIPDWSEHPVVRVHPETGRPFIFVNEVHFFEIVGLPEPESTELLRYLSEQFRRPEYQMRWHWSDHAIAVWDNRAVQHYAVRDEAGPRHVERIIVNGAASIGMMDAREMTSATGEA